MIQGAVLHWTYHIFTFKSIIERYKSHKKVYTAFIDLRKAFDTMWSEGVFYKMIMAGCPTKIFQLVG